MNFSAWSIKNPIPAIMLFLLLTLAGINAFRSMKVQNFPDVELPIITVLITLPGAAPNQLESEVARKLENALATIPSIKHIYTKIGDGTVTLTTEFRIEKPLQEALDEVRSIVGRVRGDLPASVNEPIINKVELASSPILTYTISSRNMNDEALSWYVDNDIAKLLLSVRGVGSVSRVGGVSREISVLVDPVKLQALGASVAEISQQIASIQIERAGGKAEVGGFDQPLRTLASVNSAAQLAALNLSLGNGKRITLSEIAEIKDGYAKPKSAAFLDGKPVVGFEVTRSKGASDVEVGKGVRAKLAELRKNHPDMKITESFDFVTPVEEEYEQSMKLLYEGAILAVIVVWFFLRDVRATFVSAIALPLSAIPAFIGMYYMGFSINVVTLLAMSLVVGILVDDAIVEVENIVRHMRMGKTPYQASMEAADEIGMAVIATTFTLIAVFLPTAFMTGVVGRFFKQFGWTAVFAIFASLLVARLLTPMMSAYILKPLVDHKTKPAWAQNALISPLWNWVHQHPDEPGWLSGYMRMVYWTVPNRWKTCLAALVFFVVSLWMTTLLPSGFMPPDDNSQTQVYLELSPGSSLQETSAAAEHARQLLLHIPHVRSVYTTIGSGSAGGDAFNPVSAETRKAALTIQLDPRGQRPRKQEIEAQIRNKMSEVPGARVKVGFAGGNGDKYQIALTGTDEEMLNKTAVRLNKALRGIAGVGNIESTAELNRPEISVIPDLRKAADMGVTSSAIAETLRIATVGDYDSRLSKLNLAQRQVPIVTRINDASLHNLSVLEQLYVPGSRGPVMLKQVATLRFGGGPAVISRLDRERNINFNIELAGIPLGEMKKAVDELPVVKSLPAGIKLSEVGDAEANAELASGFSMAMLTGVLLIYVVLVLLLRGFFLPVTILMALPLSFGGAFFALLVTGKMLSMPSLIGLIMLMGIATKNSILLVDYALIAQKEHGLSRLDAIYDACHKRARPIVMTSIAMCAGMLPIALEWGQADMSFRSPMAVAVIGGLVTSTLLSLLVIPPIYTLIDDASLWLRRRLGFGKQSLAQSATTSVPAAATTPAPAPASVAATATLAHAATTVSN